VINDSNIGGMTGAPVHGPDDRKIGTVGQVFVDPDTGMPNWITVHTGLFGRRASLVPLDGATWDNEVIRVAIPKETIKDAPRIDADDPLTPENEADLYRYYATHTTDAAPDDGEADAAPTATAEQAPAPARSRLRQYERSEPDAVPTGAGDTVAEDRVAGQHDELVDTELVNPDTARPSAHDNGDAHSYTVEQSGAADTSTDTDTAARAIPHTAETAQPHGRHVRPD
jgi:hypothetical protein